MPCARDGDLSEGGFQNKILIDFALNADLLFLLPRVTLQAFSRGLLTAVCMVSKLHQPSKQAQEDLHSKSSEAQITRGL